MLNDSKYLHDCCCTHPPDCKMPMLTALLWNHEAIGRYSPLWISWTSKLHTKYQPLLTSMQSSKIHTYSRIPANKNCFLNSYPRTVPEWNALPVHIRSAKSVVTFKTHQDNYLQIVNELTLQFKSTIQPMDAHLSCTLVRSLFHVIVQYWPDPEFCIFYKVGKNYITSFIGTTT